MNEIPRKMKALRLTGLGEKSLKMCEVPVSRPGPGQVFCRVDAAMACASDTKMIDQGGKHSLLNGWDVEKYPVTPGHEASLTVVDTGSDINEKFPQGTRCALQPAVPTGPLHHRERYNNNAEGMNKVAVGYSLEGAFAEYLLLTEEVISTGCLIPLPLDDIPHFAVCLAEPFSCVVAAQERHIHFSEKAENDRCLVSGIKEGGVTVLIGAGPMGIMHVDLALIRNPRAIIISEIQQERKMLAQKRFAGCRNVILVHPDQLEETLRQVSEGKGADDVIVAVGSAKLQEYSLSLLAKNGVSDFFGGAKAGDSQITVDTRRIHYDRITMVGSSGSDPGHVVEVLELLKNKRIDPCPYISAVGGIDGALDLMREVRNQRLEGKGLIYPHKRGGLQLVQGWNAEREAEFLNRP